MRHLLALLVLATLIVAPAAASAAVPVTGPATSVTASGATVGGTVDPEAAATTWHFEYGTSTAYGLRTADQGVAAATEPVPVSATLAGLTAQTTYHYRLVAGGARGADRTFTTAAAPVNPTAPGVSGATAVDRTPTSARLTARINPHRAATSYHVEWGTTSALGRSTPDQTLPAGTAEVPVSVALAGLEPYRRIRWRIVATNAAGITRSSLRSFATLRAPTGVGLWLAPSVAVWSGLVAVRGQVLGAGVGGIGVALEQSTFPFGTDLAPVATTTADGDGRFSFAARPVLAATRFRVSTRSSVMAASPVATALVRPDAELRASRRGRRRVTLVATVQPGLTGGSAALERRTSTGRWLALRGKALRVLDAEHATVAFRVERRKRSARSYRVTIAADPTGALVAGSSGAVKVSRRRGR